MRNDGRKADELRPLEFEVDYTEQPLGSVLTSMGRTRVLCSASVESFFALSEPLRSDFGIHDTTICLSLVFVCWGHF